MLNAHVAIQVDLHVKECLARVLALPLGAYKTAGVEFIYSIILNMGGFGNFGHIK